MLKRVLPITMAIASCLSIAAKENPLIRVSTNDTEMVMTVADNGNLIHNYYGKKFNEDVYHIGASLKDLGKKLFAFSKMDVMTGSALLANL